MDERKNQIIVIFTHIMVNKNMLATLLLMKKYSKERKLSYGKGLI